MRFSELLSDDTVLAGIGESLEAVRLARNWTQAALAHEAGVSKRTVERMEAGESTQIRSFIRVLRALGMLDGLEALLPPARPGPIELLEAGGKARQRASGTGSGAPTEPWSWGEDA